VKFLRSWSCLGLETQSLGLGLEEKVLFTSLPDTFSRFATVHFLSRQTDRWDRRQTFKNNHVPLIQNVYSLQYAVICWDRVGWEWRLQPECRYVLCSL